MVARHKRLVLLDAASNDREMPLPRSELVRQVLSWEVRDSPTKTPASRYMPGVLYSAPLFFMACLGGGEREREI